MFYALKFVKGDFGFHVRAIRVKPYKSFDAAKKAVLKVGSGYVKKYGIKEPVFSNVVN